jgi:hypothetical protein
MAPIGVEEHKLFGAYRPRTPLGQCDTRRQLRRSDTAREGAYKCKHGIEPRVCFCHVFSFLVA